MRSALEGERKLVTVMFCDIANSTQLAARLGAEAMHALLNRFFALALAEVHRYDGTINQFLGDGFMALFGAPVAHEDHARRALLEMGGRLGNTALVDEATGVFAQTGARVDLAFSLHVRARMERELGADVRSLLQRYDQAIAALDEVKAEYDLGVACRQRAHLHKQLGRLDQAGADLATARRCFAAVGSAVEQADVEQEAIALGKRDASP